MEQRHLLFFFQKGASFFLKVNIFFNFSLNFQAAWLRVEDKGILTIHQHVISRNYRLSLITHENRSFVLVIKNVQESDPKWVSLTSWFHLGLNRATNPGIKWYPKDTM
uniref:Uncharacterized protein n=1 Tax=Tetranychus urticae TaxID=32264 RepID=T1L5G6_TETUR